MTFIDLPNSLLVLTGEAKGSTTNNTPPPHL